MKKHNYNFKVGDIVVDIVGNKGVITRPYEDKGKNGFRGFYFEWEDSSGEDFIEEFDELSDFHRVGDYIFNDYDIDKAYGFLQDIDKQIARLQKERQITLKGIEYIKQDKGE